MTIESLLYFLAIAEGATFLEASEQFNISQSSLSKSIMRLEDELGLKLFDRSKRSAKLTHAGQTVYSNVLEIRTCYNRLHQHLKALHTQHPLTLFSIPSYTTLGIPTILRDFAIEHPDVTVNLSFLGPKDLSLENVKDKINAVMEKLCNNQLDFLVMHEPAVISSDIGITFLHSDHYFVLLPKTHRFANRKEVCFEELRDEPFLVNKWGWLRLEEIISRTGITPNNISLVDCSRENLLINISAGKAVGLFFASDLSFFSLSNFSVLRISDVVCPPWVLLSNKNNARTEAHSLLRNFLIKSMENVIIANI